MEVPSVRHMSKRPPVDGDNDHSSLGRKIRTIHQVQFRHLVNECKLPHRIMTTRSVKTPINLLRGWPSTSLLPTTQIAAAAQTALSDVAVSAPGLLYGPDPGYQPLREEVAKWTSTFYSSTIDPDRICITGGASQNMACLLQVFTDPIYTRNIWMVAPCYFLAFRIFEDSGFKGRLRAVPEGEEGIDLDYLEKGLLHSKPRGDLPTSEKPVSG